ncbi:MAG: hypothetical protein RR346_07650 [Bacteroidales bacterium]
MRLTDAQYFNLKEQIKDWILRIDEEEILPKGIKVLHFSLLEPYAIELVGSKVYNTDDDEWIYREDYVPEERVCPDLELEEDLPWEPFLKTIVRILKELSSNELKDIDLLKVPYLTTGFTNRDVVSIR